MNGQLLVLTIFGGVSVAIVFICGVWQIVEWIGDYQDRLKKEGK